MRPFIPTHGWQTRWPDWASNPWEAGVHSALSAGFLPRWASPSGAWGTDSCLRRGAPGAGRLPVLLPGMGLGSSVRALPMDGHRDGGGRQGPLSRLEGSPAPLPPSKEAWSGRCVLPAGQGLWLLTCRASTPASFHESPRTMTQSFVPDAGPRALGPACVSWR